MRTFKVQGYDDLQRKSADKDFKFAVVFRNITEGQRFSEAIGADFHISLNLAEANVKRMSKRSWIEVIGIVPVEEVAA